ncbi:SbcC/MukB-like Walker B domain-containing protein [uncultured Psychrobacter sp.]|uniref:SbcC/MukB-like Walker B domain-containing protein n=1 Tax=uncultured Psychrobacter sp. TaxID=259303 RepID=UPI002602355F|nr:SbcC/MukB-like Walker B domain-containing protein [uncultured Psychrobacter sp.]
MRLIELRLKNLNSLKGEWHIDFSAPAFLNEGIFAITGQTGAGKTTILDAICLALYSQTPRLGDITGSTNEIMTQGTGECSAEVIIEIDSTRYQCSWYQHRAHKKAKGNLLPIKHEISEVKTGKVLEEKKSKTSAYIQDLIGMDFNQFTRSIMLAQGSFAAFLKSDIGDRAAILEKITGTAIYAKISLNVHEKKRFEEEVLGKLQAGVNSLSLLNLEDEKLLAADLEILNQQQSKQRQTFKTLSEQLQWLDSVQQLQKNLSNYQAEFAAAQQTQTDFIPKAERLDLANKALEIDGPFRELNYSREMVTRLGVEQQGLLNKIPSQQEAQVEASIHLNDVNAIEKQATNNLQATLPIIAKTRELDAEIKQQSYSLADDNQRKDVLVNNTQGLRQEIASHKQTEQETKAQLSSIEKYFSDYQELNDLDTDMATFDSSCSRLKALLEDNVSLAVDKRAQVNQSSQLQAHFDKLSKQHDADSLSITEQREQLVSVQQQQDALIEKQSLASMRFEQEQINEINNQLVQASSALQKTAEQTKKIKQIKLALPTLNKDLADLEKLIVRHQSDIQDAKFKRQEKLEHLNLLQKVAKLEDYIAELKDGTPCPLCGAHEHPYGKHHPLLDRSHHDTGQHQPSKTQQTQQQIAELETVVDNLEQALSKYNFEYATKKETLNNQEQQLAPLQQQSKTLYRDIQEYIAVLFEPKNNYSEIIEAIIHPLTQIMDNGNDTTHVDHSLSLLNSTKQKLAEHKQSLKTIVVEYEHLTESAAKLSIVIEADEKQQQAVSRDINNLTTDIKLNTQKIDGIKDKITANFSELAPLMTTVSSLTHKYPADKYKEHLNLTTALNAADLSDALKQLGDSFDKQRVMDSADYNHHIEKLRQQRNALNQLKRQFNEQKNSQQQLTNTLSSVTAQIETQQIRLSNDETALNELERLIAHKTKAIEQLKQDRNEIFADKNTDNEENKLRDAVDEAKAKQVVAQRQLDTVQQALEQLKLREEQLATERQSAINTLNTQQDTFANLLAESQFIDEAAFVSARLPKEEREALHIRKLEINNALHQAKLQLDSTQQALEQKLANPMTDKSQETLASQHQQIQTDIDELNQKIGAIDQKLKDNDDRKGKQAAQLIAIDEQKQKLQVWQQLHTLIGSADGKKYRTFAQGLTFEVMIGHANSQLQKMSDRYLLIHDDSNPLELNVIDNYQGGDIRSTKNLSGGEGFIISLALALGLSQMASHNIRVDSLFLDEGFGTLDEDSLDIALDTLTSLQQEGKLIGVISHVQALKDRILTQIKVEKLSGGFSQISGQGCRRVVSEKAS